MPAARKDVPVPLFEQLEHLFEQLERQDLECPSNQLGSQQLEDLFGVGE